MSHGWREWLYFPVEQEDYIEPRAKVVRPRGGVVSPIANAGLELDRPTPKFDELGNFEINRH